MSSRWMQFWNLRVLPVRTRLKLVHRNAFLVPAVTATVGLVGYVRAAAGVVGPVVGRLAWTSIVCLGVHRSLVTRMLAIAVGLVVSVCATTFTVG